MLDNWEESFFCESSRDCKALMMVFIMASILFPVFCSLPNDCIIRETSSFSLAGWGGVGFSFNGEPL